MSANSSIQVPGSNLLPYLCNTNGLWNFFLAVQLFSCLIRVKHKGFVKAIVSGSDKINA